ncbi:hypothetical protein DL767_001797 [Monosporascus sp. MG133]|nr:hypothetical protein DL767_001797 [Monosporascus sp. MG133]
MAEVIAAIGTAGALANIIDVVGKTIATLNDIRNAWKEAELTLLCLESELGALRTAFARIQEWVDMDDGDLHHLLVMDLGRSMTCCRLLMSKIDGEMSRLQHHPDDTLSFSGKAQLVFGKKGIEELENLIQRQTSALTLLLTVCNCKTMSEQKMLLEKPKTRKVFRKIEHDTESMIVHRDKSSILSRYTGNISKLSMVFDFDHELFISRVYDRVLRASLKGAVRREQAVDRPSGAPQLDPNLDALSALEKKLPSMAPGPDRDHSALHVRRAAAQSGKGTKGRVQISEGWTAREETEAKKRSQAIDRLLTEGSKRLRNEAKVLLLGTADSGKEEILNQIRNIHLGGSSYFFDEIHRITAPDYLPNEMDVLRAQTNPSGIQDLRFQIGRLPIHLFDVGDLRQGLKKRMHFFENVSTIIFVVNLAGYDQVLLEESSLTQLMESLMLFDSVVNSGWFRRTSIVLLLNKVDLFRQKLPLSPLADYFPDYSGGNDVIKAAECILGRFDNANRAILQLYTFLINPTDTTYIQKVFAAVNETILTNELVLDE